VVTTRESYAVRTEKKKEGETGGCLQSDISITPTNVSREKPGFQKVNGGKKRIKERRRGLHGRPRRARLKKKWANDGRIKTISMLGREDNNQK